MKRSHSTQSPRASAGPITCSRCSRRAANISSVSVSCVIGCVEQQLAQPLAERRAARLARRDDALAAPRAALAKPRDVRALAGAVDAFERDEAAARSLERGHDPRPLELVSGHRAIVLGERRGELAAAVAARTKYRDWRGRRIHHGVERRLRRQRDRRRRQAVARVGVVRRVGLEVALAQVAVERVAEAVDDRRVGLQRHRCAQPVDEHRRDQRPVGGAAGLLLDDRREDQRLVGRRERQVRRALRPARRRAAPCSERCARLSSGEIAAAGGEEVRVGEELALRVRRVDRRARRDQFAVRQVDDLLARSPGARAARP